LVLGVGYLDEDVVFAAVSGEVLHSDFVSKRLDRRVKAAGVLRRSGSTTRSSCPGSSFSHDRAHNSGITRTGAPDEPCET
jgi:hypothetical protein